VVKLGVRYFVMGGELSKIEEYDVQKGVFIPMTTGLLAENAGGFSSIVAAPNSYFLSLPGGCEGVSPLL
jgi:hypothetical protein